MIAKIENNDNDTPSRSRLDPAFTDNCIKSIGSNANPRAKQIATSLFRHLHDFAREIELTPDEWMFGQSLLNECGKMWGESGTKRNEMHRLSDIFGLESLVDEIAHTTLAEKGIAPTSSAILGPFWSPDAPFRDLGASIIVNKVPDGIMVKMWGKVVDSETLAPISNAVVDVWQASTNGKYDFQDPDNQDPNNLRGKFRTNGSGEYYFYLLRPTPYSLPTDGPAGVILNALDRHPFRPAHIHLMISGEGFRPTTTQIFPKDDPYLTTDSVYAVKDDLVVDFTPIDGDKVATHQLHLDLALSPVKARQAFTNPVKDQS